MAFSSHTTNQIREAMRPHIAEDILSQLAPQHIPNFRPVGKNSWRGFPDNKFGATRRSDGSLVWNLFSEDVGGDEFAFLDHFCGVGFKDAFDQYKDLFADFAPDPDWAKKNQARAQKDAATANEERAKKAQDAVARFRDMPELYTDRSSPIEGMAANEYLTSRGLTYETAKLLRHEDWRWAKSFSFGRDGNYPAIVVGLRNWHTAKLQGFQAVALNIDGTAVKDANGKSIKRVHGNLKEGVVCVGAPKADGLKHVCEGYETALAILKLGYPKGMTQVLACLSADNLSQFPVFESAEGISIYPDNDLKIDGSNPGFEKAEITQRRWKAAQKPTVWAPCPVSGSDWGDLI